MNKFYVFIIFLSGIFISSCSSLKSSYDYDRRADFSLYKSFTFHKEALENLQMNDLDKRRITEAIEINLKHKGILKNELNAALHINISFLSKDKINTYYYDNWPMWGAWYGPWWGGTMGTRAYTYQYNEGTIIIDIIDDKTNLLLWRGQGSGINLDDLGFRKETVEKLMEKILKNFPPSRKKNN